ncbi:MAG: hypothetical protein GYB68_18485 [Chloroflexi bacterium]|nr:hypothetical protein [Chloroflexota bacterium]
MILELERIPDTPILVLYARDPEPGESQPSQSIATQISALHSKVLDLLEDYETIYRVIDFTRLHIDPSDVLHGVAQIGKMRGKPGSLSDPRVRPVFVGKHPLIEASARTLGNDPNGRPRVALFKTLDQALDFIDRERGQDSSAIA